MDDQKPIPPASNSLSAMFDRGRIEVGPPSHEDVYWGRTRSVPETIVELEPSLERGSRVFDRQRRCKAIVIKCSIERTTDGVSIHKVVDKRTGLSWKQSEKYLELLE